MSVATCRICLQKNDKVVNIFGDSLISRQIVLLTKIQISPDDGLPSTICLKCNKNLEYCIEFVELCKKSDLYLRSSLTHSNEDIKELNNDYLHNGIQSPEIKEDFSVNYDMHTVSSLTHEPRKKYECSESTDSKIFRRPQCSICGKVMSSRFRLKTHLATHSQEKSFSCQYCDKKFSIHQNLKVHLRTHMGEKPYQCSICEKKFAQSSGLTVHKRKHSGLLPYKCNLCPRNFRTIGHLQYHVRSHTGEKSFECSTCERSFITNSDLKSHVMTHTGEKPHICPMCGMQFSRASNLRRHLQHSHQKVENYSCNHCKMKFFLMKDLEIHKCEDTNKLD